MIYDTPHRKYLELASATTGLRGKIILEVGGSTPPSIVSEYAVAAWTSVNLDANSVATANEEASRLGNRGYLAIRQDIRTFKSAASYDVVYSVNAFEHIQDLGLALRKMLCCLRPGGQLFTLFGPIWSSDVGHHLSVRTDDHRELNFNDGVLGPWEHLTANRSQIHARLAKQYGPATAERAITYIFDYPDLNRLSESQYLMLVEESGFSRVMLIRKRVGVAPKIPGASNTREFLMILKKGDATFTEKIFCLTKFAVAHASLKIRALVAKS